jgi:glycine cleavage system aminomethyltransferase T
LSPALARSGGEIDIRGEQGEILKARIAPTPFYDPKNARQRPVAAA